MMNQTIYKIRTIAIAFVLLVMTLSGASAQGTTAQTITFTEPVNFIPPITNILDARENDVYNIAATASSGLPVRFSIDNTVIAILKDAGDGTATVRILAVGRVLLTVTQAGDATYAPTSELRVIDAPQGTMTQTISLGSLRAGWTVGETVPLSATATSGLPVRWSMDNPAIATLRNIGDGRALLELHAVGKVRAMTSQAGNGTYAAVSENNGPFYTFNVGRGAQTIIFRPSGGLVGADIDLTASASSGLDVRFAIASQSPASGADVATLSDGVLSLENAGTVDITASQNGDTNYLDAPDVTRTITVRPAGDPATVFYVTDSGDPANDGSDWANATTLQAALTAAVVPGDQVWIAASEYVPHVDDRAATFSIPAGVEVYGGFNPATDNAIDSRTGGATILSGDLGDNDGGGNYDDNSYTVVTVGGDDVTLDGLTIQAGEGGSDFSFQSTDFLTIDVLVGAGLLSDFDNTSVVDCDFQSNRARNSNPNDPVRFDGLDLFTLGGGAGAFFSGDSPTLTNCRFVENTAGSFGGGGAYFTSIAATLTNCVFTNNTTRGGGGGAAFNEPATVINSVFANNNSSTRNNENTERSLGGGLLFANGGTVINSTFYQNGSVAGGGIAVAFRNNSNSFEQSAQTSFSLQNSILIQNTGGGQQVYVANDDAAQEVIIQNNIIHGGSTGDAPGLVYANAASENITEEYTIDERTDDDVFESIMASEENYLRLRTATPVSPAAGVGDNDFIPLGITTDAAGDDRIQNGVVDLGAYESDLPLQQTITFTSAEAGFVEETITLEATTNSGEAVTFDITEELSPNGSAAVDGAVATLAAGVLTLTGPGTVEITATHAGGTFGNVIYTEATATQTISASLVPSIRRVIMNGGRGNDGSDWTNAMLLDEALAASTVAGDQIWIAGGRYEPTAGTDREATFTIPEGVRVYGGFVGTDVATDDDGFDPEGGTDDRARDGDGTLTNETILSGDLSADDGTRPAQDATEAVITAYNNRRIDNSYTVVIVGGNDVTLDGLTISGGQGGSALVEDGRVDDDTIIDGVSDTGGAGLYSYFLNTVLNDCTFTDNEADAEASDSYGGGAYFVLQATLTGCTFTGNGAAFGGGAFIYGGSTLTDCTFEENYAFSGGGASFFEPGTTLINCTFSDNYAAESGGGAEFSDQTTLIGCEFSDNEAVFGGGVYFLGEGLEAELTLISCDFTGNEADLGGGAFFREQATLISSTFTSNEAVETGGGVVFEGNGALLINCVFANNNAAGATDDHGAGGLFLVSGGTVINSTFYSNTAAAATAGDSQGGAILVAFSDTDNDMAGVQTNPFNLQNSILIGNTADGNGDQAYVDNTDEAFVVNLQNNLIEGGADPVGTDQGVFYGGGGSANTMQAGTVDVSDAAVVFASTTSSEPNYLRLSAASPAVDAGNNDYVNNAVPPITTDAEGEMRIQGGTVDLGAYESNFIAQTITFASPAVGRTGSTIPLVATATSTGAVTFAITEVRDADGNVVTGVAADAVATLMGTTLTLGAVGTVTVTASQAGGDIDGTIYAAATQTQTITVTDVPPISQTIMFTSPAEGPEGSTIPLVATATSTGAVTFAITEVRDTDGNVVMDAAADAVATLMGTTLKLVAPGTVTVTASQAGGNINGVIYAAATQTQTITVTEILPTTQTIAFASPDTGTVGTPITLAATATSGLDVTFEIESQSPTSGSGDVATLSGTMLTLVSTGTVVITATQAGGDSGGIIYAPATETQTITVTTTQTISFTSPDTGTVGTPIPLAATASSGLDVTFAITDQSPTSGAGDVATLLGTTLTLVSTGTVVITATQAGGDSGGIAYASATETQTITVSAATGTTPQSITFMLDATGTAGIPITLVATATSGLDVSFAITDQSPASGAGDVATLSGATLNLVSEGTVTITALQGGNDTYAAATDVMQTITVSKQTQTITFMPDATGTVGTPITLAATATSGLDVSFAITSQSPTSGAGDVATLSGAMLTLVSEGTVTITASQGGDDTYEAATDVMQTITVSKQTQTITFMPDATGTVGTPITLAATADSGLDVSFAITDQSPTSGAGDVATLSGATLTLVSEGTVTITASQGGNDTYALATETQTITVSKQTQTITFTLDATGMVDTPITLAATTTSGLDVSFAITDQSPTSGTGDVATLSGATLTLENPGTVTITASQGGNDTYAAATDVMQTITVEAVLGLEEDADGFVLYPNPTSGKLHFSEQVGQFRLYSVEGRLLEVWENVRSVDLMVRPAGLYFAEVIRDGRSVRYRVVRE